MNPPTITPLQGITDRAADGAVTFEAGRPSPRSVPITGRLLASTDGGDPAVRLDYFARGDLSGPPLRSESQQQTTAVWLGEPAPGVPAGAFSARLSAALAPDVSGPWTLSVSVIGAARLYLDGELLADTTGAASGAGLLGLFTTPVEAEATLDAGSTYEVVAELDVEAQDRSRSPA